MDRVLTARRPRALIAGGSLGGIFTALLLHRANWEVRVFERIGADLSVRGAGIVTHPELFDILAHAGIDRSAATVGVEVKGRRVFGRDGAVDGELSLPQLLTSWGALYKLLRDALPVESYQQDRNVLSAVESLDGVSVTLNTGETVEGDLLVGADGLFSTIRGIFRPDLQPSYVGYIAWRGLVDEVDLSPATRSAIGDFFSFSLPVGEQMLGYPVAAANGDLSVGKRRFNFVWYRPAAVGEQLSRLLTDTAGTTHPLSIPPHMIRPEIILEMRHAARSLLSPQFAEVVEKTAQPFIQAIQDLEVTDMRMGRRTVILGDAAFVARPHVGMGVTKAAGDAWSLARAIGTHGADLRQAIAQFNRERVAFGAAVIKRARHLGAYMQAQALTEEERMMAERHRKPEAIMAETAVATGIAA